MVVSVDIRIIAILILILSMFLFKNILKKQESFRFELFKILIAPIITYYLIFSIFESRYKSYEIKNSPLIIENIRSEKNKTDEKVFNIEVEFSQGGISEGYYIKVDKDKLVYKEINYKNLKDNKIIIVFNVGVVMPNECILTSDTEEFILYFKDYGGREFAYYYVVLPTIDDSYKFNVNIPIDETLVNCINKKIDEINSKYIKKDNENNNSFGYRKIDLKNIEENIKLFKEQIRR